jgi:hypothetical protein
VPSFPSSEVAAAREWIVLKHIADENAHDAASVVAGFHAPKCEVIAMGTVVDGANNVEAFLGELIAGFPDFSVDDPSLMHAETAVVVEARISGTHAQLCRDSGVWPPHRRSAVRAVCL